MKIPAAISAFVLSAACALAQPAPPPPAPGQLTPQVLGEMLRTATTFHEVVRSLNLYKQLGPDVHVVDAYGVPRHSAQRTAATVGAGVGVGAAIGGMTRNQNGVLIGALIGGAGGLILDEILKRREMNRMAPAYDPAPMYSPAPEPPPLPPLRQRP